MNDKNIEDFQQWNLLGNKGQKEIMDRLRNPKLSCNHLDCQNCHTLRNTLTQYKEALRELWSDIHFTDLSKEEISDRIGKLIK